MSTATVSARAVSEFDKYAKLGQRSAKLEKKIAVFLAQLVDVDTRERVEALCEDQLFWLREEYSPNSMPNRISKYCRAIQGCFDEYPIPEPLADRKATRKGGIVERHYAVTFFLAASNQYDESIKKNRAKTEKDEDNNVAFPMYPAIAAIEAAVASSDWRELAAGLIFACQARPYQIVQDAQVAAVSRYKIRFVTTAKKRGETVEREIFTIVPAVDFIDSLSRLRRESSIIELRELSASEIDSRVNKRINRKVLELFGDIVPPPITEKQLSAHNLRAAGVTIAYHLYSSTKWLRFTELQLVHEGKASVANYNDYKCVDEKGVEIEAKGIRQDADAPLTAKPKSKKRSSVSVDAQLRDMVGNAERWGEGSHADRLERIIARAEAADRLERQLALECEKRQRLELELKRLQKSPNAQAEKPVAKPAVEAKPAAKVEPAAVEPTGFDWRSVPNTELVGDRRRDAYTEKLRRSVEAIQEYNAGLPDDEHILINGSALRQVSGVKPAKVKDWIQAHQAELDSYNAGYSSRQNVGKLDPKDSRVIRSRVKWSEQAYGSYDW